jgi:hypothetical protein
MITSNSILIQRLDTIFQKAQEKRRDAQEKNRKKKEAESKAAPKRQPKKAAVKSEKVESTTIDAFLMAGSLKHCCFLFTDEIIELFKAGSDDEDYGAPMPKPAAQRKKPAKKVGSFSKPPLSLSLSLSLSLVCVLCLQVNSTIS